MGKITTRAARVKRHHRVRLKISGNSSRPRLAVYRSLSHIYAQIIDDTKGATLVSASTLDKDFKAGNDGKAKKTNEAETVGSLLAKRALSKGIELVTFDRGGYRYHGRVKALAEAARKGGLKF